MEPPDTDAGEQALKKFKRPLDRLREQNPPDLPHREAFSVAEFCRVYGISRPTFYSEVARGRLRARKLGTKTIVLKRDADAWTAAMPELLGWAPPPRKTKPPA